MGTWSRCPKSFFYRKTYREGWIDQRVASFDRSYVDPVDLVLVRTVPWRKDQVHVLHWRIVEINEKSFLDLAEEPAAIIMAWSERIMKEETEDRMSRKKKEGLLDDLDVDPYERDRLLDAIAVFVNVSPPEVTSLLQKKVPRNDDAVGSLLFHFGVGPC